MSDNVLFVDDEEYVLKALQRVCADDDSIRAVTASSAAEALRIMENMEIAVLVSDHRMPGTTGTDLLKQAKHISRDTVKILMTGYADLPTAIDAINSCEVFRFIVKPWNNEALLETVHEGINRYRLTQSLRREDEAVFRSLGQTIELKDRYTKGHCDRVASYALMIAEGLNLAEEFQESIKQGSWLHDCGKIGIPEAVLNFEGTLNEREFETIRKHPIWGAEVARQADLPKEVINIILYHHERFDGQGYPHGLAGEAIPLEARIVAVADTYDALTSDRPYHKAFHWQKALGILEEIKGRCLDPALVEIFLAKVNALTEK
ncbi:MAG TPA: HD domain-containing phosphohydrolase [Geobacteraceae bacterium]